MAHPLASSGSDLGARLDDQIRHERQRALRALLQTPLLTPGGPRCVDFGLARRHAAWLQDWLAKNTAWGLQVSSDVVRLRKLPVAPVDGSRAATDSKKRASVFSRRCYVLLCLVAATLERSDRQTTLSRLAEGVLSMVSADPGLARAGIAFDLSTAEQRRDLVRAIRLLLDLRVLIRVQGDEHRYIQGQGDALYNVERPALAALLCVNRGPSTVMASQPETTLDSRIDAIIEEILPQTDQGRFRGLRTQLVRRLLDDPVLYYADLTQEQLEYLHRQRGLLLRQIEEATGLVPEIRAEGIALLDPRAQLSDLALPEEGTDGHLTLLLAEHLADIARHDPGRTVSVAALESHTAELIRCHARHWRKDVREPGAERGLTRQTLDRLLGLGLLRRVDSGVIPLPAIGRFALASPAAADAGPPAPTLPFGAMA